MHALIVDDDAEMSGVFWRFLSQWGWTADQCHSVSGALALARGGRYDLALCDVDLPDGNGISLAWALLKAGAAPRVVVTSGDPENLRRARAAGLAACLDKPFEPGALKVLVDADLVR